jgi:hypothetical protein
MVGEVSECRLKERTTLYNYVKSVGDLIGREEALKLLRRINVQRELKWIEENLSKLDIKGNDAIAARDLLDAMFAALVPGYKPPKRLVNTAERVIYENCGYCTIYEAAKNTGLTVEEVCGLSFDHEPAIKRLNPRLVKKTIDRRPEADCCRSEIILEK